MEKMADQVKLTPCENFGKYFARFKQVSMAYFLCYLDVKRQSGHRTHVFKMLDWIVLQIGGEIESEVKLDQF